MIGIVGLFLAGFFLLVVFGAKSYGNIVAAQNGNMETRATLSYISTSVKGSDSAGAVEIMDSEYGHVLIINDGDTGFALRIYRCNGELVEDFAASGAGLSPENSQVIGETQVFEVERPCSDMLIVRTDEGRVILRLRSEGSGR